MPAFLEFRLWLKEGPVRERVLTAVVGALVLALLVMVSLPLRDETSQERQTLAAGGQRRAIGGTTKTDVATDAVDGSTTGPTSGGGSSSRVATGGSTATRSGVSGGTGATSANECSGRTASAPGITATEVHLDISLVDLAGPVGNTAFNIRPDLHEISDAIVDDINKTGGLACGRKLVIKQYDVNPIDANDQQSTCLQMVQDKPFAVIDNAGYITPGARACFVQNKLPFQLSTSAATKELNPSYPYLFGMTAPSEKQVRDGILGLNENNFFAAPKFLKLGLMEDSCEPEVNAELEANLAKIGVKPQQISKYTLSCQLIAPPNEILQGVVQHKGAGATHVFLATSISNSQRYTQLAAQQDFHPTYGTADYGTNTASVGDWDPSFAGSLAISSQHSGDLNSGMRTAEVNNCDRILKAHGLNGITTERNDGAATSLCDQFFFFRQAINRVAANPTRTTFISTGVSHMGTFKAGAGSDGVFDAARKVVGGDFHRTIQFNGDCTCWKIHGSPSFLPGF